MPIVIVLYDKDSSEISILLKDLASMGWLAQKDFDFAYTPGKFDWVETKQLPRKTTFTFYNSKAAVWFSLKYKV